MSTHDSKKKESPPKSNGNWNGDPMTGPPKTPAVKPDGTYDPFLALPKSKSDGGDGWLP